MKDPPKLIGLVLIFAFVAIAIAGCGEFSNARVTDLENQKRNHVQDVERALDGELTAVELRGSLDSIDKAILAEHALKGDEAELEALRAKIEADSDKLVADLFDGDNGRDPPDGAGTSPRDTATGALDAGG